jgi:ribosomal protein L34E
MLFLPQELLSQIKHCGSMGLFKKKEEQSATKCKECGLELHDPVRLDRHMKKAHKHAPQRNFDEPGTSTGGMW